MKFFQLPPQFGGQSSDGMRTVSSCRQIPSIVGDYSGIGVCVKPSIVGGHSSVGVIVQGRSRLFAIWGCFNGLCASYYHSDRVLLSRWHTITIIYFWIRFGFQSFFVRTFVGLDWTCPILPSIIPRPTATTCRGSLSHYWHSDSKGKFVSPRIPYCLFWMRVYREKSFPPVYLIVCYGCGCIGKIRFPPYTLLFVLDAGV